MAQTKVRFDRAVEGATNIVDSGTEGTRVATGTSAQRGSTQGQFRFNTTTGLAEYYTGTDFKSIDSPPTITNISPTALDTAGGQTITVTGTNFATSGTVSVSVGGTVASSVSIVRATSLTFTSPAKSAGDYELKVTNPSNLSGVITISYSADPSWNTAVDTVIAEDTQGSSVNITNVTASEGSDTIDYSEVTSVLSGIGMTLNTTTGAITGTLPTGITADTIYTFTLRATDDENQTADRQFKIRNLVNFFGDGSDGDLST